ncbi:class II fumarate hydratase [Vibrio breoganii]
MNKTFRVEKDSMGEIKVPFDALYQAQTQRAIDNFKISKHEMPKDLIVALAYIKQASAKTNSELGTLNNNIAGAIIKAAQYIIDGQYHDQFPIDVFQTGSGTSTNMNANEVLATLASQILNEKVSPNDHVNMGQSSNDVMPTSIQVSAVMTTESLLIPALTHLTKTLRNKQKELEGIVKTGRTHLMDAMPITFSQELSGWEAQVQHASQSIASSLEFVRALGQGGTAVGTGINAHSCFAAEFCHNLSQLSSLSFEPSDNFYFNLSCQDSIISLSGQLKTLAVALIKISNDLRWMNSGPLAGLGEIELKALQPGSSIMPGKVNPVIPEAVAMASAQVIGNDTTITIAGQSGNFQLNVMLPVIAHNLLESIHLLTNSCISLADKAIEPFKVRQDNIDKILAKNPILITVLNPILGYLKTAEIAGKAYIEGRSVIDVAEEETNLSRRELENYFDPKILTRGGIM